MSWKTSSLYNKVIDNDMKGLVIECANRTLHHAIFQGDVERMKSVIDNFEVDGNSKSIQKELEHTVDHYISGNSAYKIFKILETVGYQYENANILWKIAIKSDKFLVAQYLNTKFVKTKEDRRWLSGYKSAQKRNHYGLSEERENLFRLC